MLGFNGKSKKETAADISRPNRGLAHSETPLSATRSERTAISWRRSGRNALQPASLEELERELARCRRYGHSLFVARILCQGEGDARLRRSQEAASLLRSVLRNVDRAWADGPNVFVLLPECDRAMGARALARIRQPLARVLSEGEQNGISSVAFPDKECLTGRALVDELLGRARRRKAHRPRQAAEPFDGNGRPGSSRDQNRPSTLSAEGGG